MKTRTIGIDDTLNRWTDSRTIGESRDQRDVERELGNVNRQLAQAVNRNQELVNALHDACEQITSLKEEVDKLNHADSLIFQTEKQLTEYGDKISAANKENIQRALSALKDAHKNKDLAAIDTTMQELNTAWSAASEEMYKASQAAGGAQQDTQPGEQPPQGDGSQTSGDGNVTDVPYEEVKDEKK